MEYFFEFNLLFKIIIASCLYRTDIGIQVSVNTDKCWIFAQSLGGELLFNDSLWLLGDFTPNRSNEVWNSADEIIWNQMPIPLWEPRNLKGTIEFDGKIWLMGGYVSGTGVIDDIYSSEDGKTWQLDTSNANWPPRSAFWLSEMNNKLYLYRGSDQNSAPLNDVRESIDGIN